MAQTYRFYLVKDDGEVQGTNNFEVAAVAKRDGATLVIEPGAAESTYDGDSQPIEAADDDEWLGEDDDEDDDDEEQT